MNLSWLLLVLGLGHTEASCCMFNRIQEVVQHEPIPAIHMEKQREWAHKLGRTESLEISRVGPTVLARLMESQMWHLPVDSVALLGEDSEKG